MTAYYPGPFEVEIFYVEGGITHKQRLNCDIVAAAPVGDPFSAFSVALRNGSNIPLDTALLAYLTLFRALFAATTNFTIANLYQYVPESYDKSFLATYDINLLGTGAGAANLNHQTILTFTSQLGNGVRFTTLDDNATLNSSIPIRDASAQIIAYANYVVGGTAWMLARDGSYPAGRLNSSQGQNEALFKARNR